jgi:hypothetical protein
MLSIADNIRTYTNSRTTPYSVIQNNVFPGASTEEIIIRADPSPKREVEYLDGSGQSSLSFAFYTKSKDQKKAREQLETFISVLDMCPGFALTGAQFVKLEAVTMPVLVSYNEAKEYVFTASFNLIFE